MPGKRKGRRKKENQGKIECSCCYRMCRARAETVGCSTQQSSSLSLTFGVVDFGVEENAVGASRACTPDRCFPIGTIDQHVCGCCDNIRPAFMHTDKATRDPQLATASRTAPITGRRERKKKPRATTANKIPKDAIESKQESCMLYVNGFKLSA